jgi:hypothetical protein
VHAPAILSSFMLKICTSIEASVSNFTNIRQLLLLILMFAADSGQTDMCSLLKGLE